MRHPGLTLIVIGLLIAGIGLVWLIAPSIPWLGKLPGDIRIERENFRFYCPADDLHSSECGTVGDHVGGQALFKVMGQPFQGNARQRHFLLLSRSLSAMLSMIRHWQFNFLRRSFQ